MFIKEMTSDDFLVSSSGRCSYTSGIPELACIAKWECYLKSLKSFELKPGPEEFARPVFGSRLIMSISRYKEIYQNVEIPSSSSTTYLGLTFHHSFYVDPWLLQAIQSKLKRVPKLFIFDSKPSDMLPLTSDVSLCMYVFVSAIPIIF